MCFTAIAQVHTPDKKGRTIPKILKDTQVAVKLDRIVDSVKDPVIYQDSVRIKEENERNERNLNAIVELQRDRRAKQKKAAIIQIALGVGFLIILFIGLARRRKLKD